MAKNPNPLVDALKKKALKGKKSVGSAKPGEKTLSIISDGVKMDSPM